jgi:hypothetical protein
VIDFAVGYGPDQSYDGDSTALAATIAYIVPSVEPATEGGDGFATAPHGRGFSQAAVKAADVPVGTPRMSAQSGDRDHASRRASAALPALGTMPGLTSETSADSASFDRKSTRSTLPRFGIRRLPDALQEQANDLQPGDEAPTARAAVGSR